MISRERDFINKEAIIDLGSNSIRMLIYDNILNSGRLSIRKKFRSNWKA